MTLYTSEVVAQHLDVTERRVRQLRDEGIIREKRPGLYNLVDAMTRYIKYVNAGSKVDLNDERAKLTKVKREAAEMENRVRKAELMEVGDVEKAYSTVMMNFRSRILALPQKLAPAVASMEGDQQQIQVVERLDAGERYIARPNDPRLQLAGRRAGRRDEQRCHDSR